MTSRERVASLLKREIPDRMGFFEHFWKETLRDDGCWVQQGYPAGVDPEHYFDYDIAYCDGWLDSSFAPGRESEILEETEEWKITRDSRGSTLKYWKNKSGTPEHVGFEVTSPEIWKKYRDTLLEFNPQRLGNLDNVRKKLADAQARGKFAVYGNIFVFEIMRVTMGDVSFLPALIEDPEWIRDFCQVYLDSFRMHYERLFHEAGLPDGMLIYEDFAFSNGLFCSPQILRDLIMPYEKALVSFFKDYGIPVILHSCGDVRKALPLIIDAGFDCLQPMEAKAGCDVVEMAKTYGNKISYMGNIDVVSLNTNDPLRIKEEVLPKVTELQKMRIPYFFHSDHSIPPSVGFKTYEYAVQIFRENDRY